jgi:hypothetical protein
VGRRAGGGFEPCFFLHRVYKDGALATKDAVRSSAEAHVVRLTCAVA